MIIYITYNDLKDNVKDEIFQIALEESLKEYAKTLGIEYLLKLKYENGNLLFHESLEKIVDYLYKKNKEKTREEIREEIEDELHERAEIMLNKFDYIFKI